MNEEDNIEPARTPAKPAERDVAARKREEENLRRFAAVMRNSNDAITIQDFEGQITAWNRGAERMYGYSEEEALQMNIDRLTPPGKAAEQKDFIRRLMAGDAITSFETQRVSRDGRVLDVWMTVSKLVDDTGEPIGLASTERDITARKRAEEALRVSEEKHRRLIENSHDIIYTLTPDGVLDFVSPAWTAFLGHPVAQVAGQPLRSFVHPDDLAGCVVFLKSVIETGQRQEGVEYRVRHADGSWHWHATSACPLKDAAGRITGFEGVARDISERKRVEETRLRSEQALRKSQQIGRLGSWEWDIASGKLTWSDELCRIWGVPKDFELTQDSITAMIHPDDREQNAAKLREILESAAEVRFEFRIVKPDGVTRYLHQIVEVSRDSAGKAIRAIGIMQDITERKQAEEALRESEQRFRELFENMSSGVAIYEAVDNGQDFIFRDFNAAGERIEQVSRDRLVGRRVTEVFPGVEPMGLLDVLRRVWKTGAPEAYPASLYQDDRIVGWRENRVYKLPSGEVVAIYDDVTTRKQAEEALRTSEAQLSNALQIARAGHWEYDVASDTFTFNDNFYRIFRTTAAEVGGYTMRSADYARKFCHPDDLAVVGKEIKKSNATRDPNYSRQLDHRILYADGEVGHISVRFFVVQDSQGRTVKTYGVNQDITHRKRAEEALRLSESLLNEVGRIAKIGGWKMDLVTRKATWTQGTYDIVEIEPGQPIPGPDEHVDFYLPEYRPMIAEAMRALIEDDKPLDFEAQLRTAKGNIKWCRAQGRALREDGKAVQVYGTFQDITERKRAEAELRFKNLVLSTQQETSIDGILVVDENALIVSYNHRFVEMWNVPKEFIENRMDEPVLQHVTRQLADPQAFLQRVRHLYEHRQETGRDELILADGRIFDRYTAPMFTADGRYHGRVWYFRDITERKRAEEKLEKQLDELRRWHEATLGREGRIAELKREVNELLARRGEKPRYGEGTRSVE